MPKRGRKSSKTALKMPKMPKMSMMKPDKLMKDIGKILKKNNAVLYLLMLLVVAILGKTIFDTVNFTLWKHEEPEGNTNGKSMVLFYWKDCGHCKRMMPEWDRFQSSHGTTLEVKKVEKDEDKALMEKHGISSFPTILLLDRNGKKIKQYEGDRTIKAMKKFAEENQ